MHAVDVGVGSDDDLVVAQPVEPVLDVEGSLQEVELLVLVDDLLRQPKGVERLASQAEHRLGVDVAALGDGTAGGVSLGDEDAALLAHLSLRVVEVDAAVAQLAVVHVDFLGTLTGYLRDAGYLLAFLLGAQYLVEHDVGRLGRLMEEVVHFGLDEVADELVEARASVGRHRGRAELHLCLALEDGLLYVDGDGGNQSVADVGELHVLVVKLLDGSGDVFLEGALVRATLRGVLSVDKGVVLLAVLVGMGEGYLDVVGLQVHDGIEGRGRHPVVEQVDESVSREDAPPVVHDGKPCVEVCVVAEHRLHDLGAEGEVHEDGVVGGEGDPCAVLVGRAAGGVLLQLSSLERHRADLSLAEAACLEGGAERVDGLGADAIQADALLEGLAVVLASCVEHADSLDELALRDAAPIVAHGDVPVVVDVYLDALAGIHLEFVDAVVDDLFQEDVDAVVALRPVAQLADVHTGTDAHMLHVAEVPYVLVGILYLFS